MNCRSFAEQLLNRPDGRPPPPVCIGYATGIRYEVAGGQQIGVILEVGKGSGKRDVSVDLNNNVELGDMMYVMPDGKVTNDPNHSR